MRVNIGTTDRIARAALGLALVAYSLPLGIASVGWHWVGLFGTLLCLTALFAHCPVYAYLGRSTCAVPLRNESKSTSAGDVRKLGRSA